MKVETTIGALVDAEPALLRVLSVPLAARTRYHAVKLAKLVAAETRHFRDEQEAAIKALGTERDATPDELKRGLVSPITEVTPANMATYTTRMKDLREVQVSLAWGPLTTSMVEPYPAVTGKDCLELGPLYELDPEPPAPAQEPAGAPS